MVEWDIVYKNTIRDGGSTALYITVDTIYTVYTGDYWWWMDTP